MRVTTWKEAGTASGDESRPETKALSVLLYQVFSFLIKCNATGAMQQPKVLQLLITVRKFPIKWYSCTYMYIPVKGKKGIDDHEEQEDNEEKKEKWRLSTCTLAIAHLLAFCAGGGTSSTLACASSLWHLQPAPFTQHVRSLYLKRNLFV